MNMYTTTCDFLVNFSLLFYAVMVSYQAPREIQGNCEIFLLVYTIEDYKDCSTFLFSSNNVIVKYFYFYLEFINL